MIRVTTRSRRFVAGASTHARRCQRARHLEGRDELRRVAVGVPDLLRGASDLSDEVRDAEVRRETHVPRVRHDDVGDDAGLEAAHAVGEDDRRHAAERLEALGQETQRGLATLIEGEAHEAHAAPDQDRTKMRSGPT